MPEKYSVNRLYTETDYDRRTIKRWLDAAGKAPCDIDGKNEYFALRDFCESIRHDEAQKHGGGEDGDGDALIRKTNLQADILEIEKAKLKNTVLDTDEVFAVLENRDIAIRRVILTSELTDAVKDKILNALRTISIDDIIAERSIASGVVAAGK